MHRILSSFWHYSVSACISNLSALFLLIPFPFIRIWETLLWRWISCIVDPETDYFVAIMSINIFNIIYFFYTLVIYVYTHTHTHSQKLVIYFMNKVMICFFCFGINIYIPFLTNILGVITWITNFKETKWFLIFQFWWWPFSCDKGLYISKPLTGALYLIIFKTILH